jgi:spore germination protein
MKQIISPLQFAFVLSNFLFTATLITLPQVLTQISKQYTWLVPIVVFPVILLIFYMVIRKSESFGDILSPNQLTITHKLFTIILLIFLFFIYIRDLRAFIDFIRSYYLPETPVDILIITLTLTLIYVGSSGLETIARITVIQTVILGTIIILLPLLLLNEIDVKNLSPIITTGTITNLAKSSYILFPWMGEAFLFLFLLGNISMEKKAMKAITIGLSLGMFFFSVLLLLIIAVLGEFIASLATYPNIFMIQEIHLTDFLDRLDMVIVIIWAPCLFCRIALILYCINRALSNLRIVQTNLLFTPIGLLLGILTILLFNKNTDHLKFSFFTWGSLGTILEILILALFLVLKFKTKLKNKAA